MPTQTEPESSILLLVTSDAGKKIQGIHDYRKEKQYRWQTRHSA